MKPERIREEWNRYVAKVYHVHLEGDQARQLRMAFFGGAAATLKILLKNLAPGDEPTEEDLQVVRDMQAELHAFTEATRQAANPNVS